MDKAIFSLSLILGMIFLLTGNLKLFIPKNQLESKGVKGLESLNPTFIKVLATMEIVGAILLILSLFLGLPKIILHSCLIGFALLMVGATFHHLIRSEFKNANVTVILFLAILFLIIFKD
jgi:hypothetical protein